MTGASRGVRLLTGLLVPLLLAACSTGATGAGAGVERCGTDTGPSGRAVRLCVSVPTDPAGVTDRRTVTAELRVSGGPAPEVNGISYSLDGSYLLFVPQQPYSFVLHTYLHPPGRHTLTASVAFATGPPSTPVSVSIDLPATAVPPVPPFHATAGADRPGQPFVAAAVGDGASGLAAEQQVTDLITSWYPGLFLYLGDVYAHGSPEEYANWYGQDGQLFGRLRAVTDPVLGNHEFELDRSGAPYFRFWGDPPAWYSVDTHGWHVVVLDNVGPTTDLDVDSPQYRWLAADLAAHPNPCTLVAYHRPRFTVGTQDQEGDVSEAATDFDAFWRLIAGHHVPLVLNGHSHNYQRWQPLDVDGRPVPAGGTTEFVVGTGGQWLSRLSVTDPRLAVGFDTPGTARGALRLQLFPAAAGFQFVTVSGAVEDAGSVPCAPR